VLYLQLRHAAPSNRAPLAAHPMPSCTVSVTVKASAFTTAVSAVCSCHRKEFGGKENYRAPFAPRGHSRRMLLLLRSFHHGCRCLLRNVAIAMQHYPLLTHFTALGDRRRRSRESCHVHSFALRLHISTTASRMASRFITTIPCCCGEASEWRQLTRAPEITRNQCDNCK
jgi:hypothetical protein